MADATHKLGANFRDKIIKMAALRLSDDADGDTTNYVEILVGTGDPSGTNHLDAGTRAIYVRLDGSGKPDLLWYTEDGGNNWSRIDDGGTTMQVEDLGSPATASTTACHALFAGNDASNDFPGPFTNPDTARTLVVDFQASWDGGDVTVLGQDQWGGPQSETFTAAPGSTVAGTKVFGSTTSATKGAVGVNAAAASIGTGTTLGLSIPMSAPVGVLAVNGKTEIATWDDSEGSVAPTTAPDGSKTFTALHG